MAKFYLFVLLILFVSCSSDALKCESGWILYKDELCIKAFTDLATHDEARDFCLSQAPTASLVLAKDSVMQELVTNSTSDVFDNLWLGATYNEESGQYHWDDGEPLSYTNWLDGYPRNSTDSACVELRPVNAKLGANADGGKWADVNCQKRNLVMCQKPSSWGLEDAVEEIIKIRKKLEDIEAVNRELQVAAARVVPVGSIYVEYYNQPSPTSLWPDLSWEDVTGTYGGLFFRASGGGAESWGNTQEECSPRIAQMQTAFPSSSEGFQNPLNFSKSSGWSQWGYGGAYTIVTYDTFESLRFYTESCEVRPRNQAIRIWKRIA